MAQVKLEIGGRSFMVTCQDGEEEHLGKLGAMVDAKAGEAGDPAGLTESRMLLFTSLLLADELHGTKNKQGNSPTPQAAIPSANNPPKTDDAEDERVLLALEKLADRAEAFANSLEQTGNVP
ncbi:cell division protein ZapA [Parasphingorhabdus cellanae]|uniref:Cell division protein ZapA n=1 Tax=Parasphingorhabdus cellanae TaxID=2806553 RepID=A0ABX7T5F3_9SPHN|nr:cell division protein ZapA [Parasphingorhabdus cellanae]QTD56045.1 cell division protein ZapA [Parasphingorhabdus cellanae]